MTARLVLILCLAVALAPGVWLRTPVVQGLDRPITLRVIDEPGADPPPGWSVQGVWEYSGDGLLFGGYSALLALDGGRLQAFSDRGGRFTFLQPDQSQGAFPQRARSIAVQPVDEPYEMQLFDIEAAVRDPATGDYWLAFEFRHAIARYSLDGEGSDKTSGVRIIEDEVDWPGNAGAEAMVRLADGRFLVIPEGGHGALLYSGDPVAGGAPVPVAYTPPPGDFSVTDAAQLPDGRLALLLRRVAWGVPPFEALIAIADWPDASGDADLVIAPRIVLDLKAVLPPDNYEGLALREHADGTLNLWVIADDNLSVMQRTLVAKLRFDPAAVPSGGAPEANPPSKRPKQKARE